MRQFTQCTHTRPVISPGTPGTGRQDTLALARSASECARRRKSSKPKFWMLFLLLLAAAVTGCSAQVAAETATGVPGYTGTLDTSYQNALDPIGQLALGTLSLEGTADAVTVEQAAALLPLWQALQGNDLQGDAERYAAAKLIETTMTEAQIAAIAARQFTQEDVRAWMQDQGAAGPAANSQGAGGSPMPEEQTAQMREQFAKQGMPVVSASSSGLIRAVVALLSERSGTGDVLVEPATPVVAQPTPSPAMTPTVTPSSDSTEIEPTPTAVQEPTFTPTPEAEAAQKVTVTAEAEQEATPTQTAPGYAAAPAATPLPAAPASASALVQIEDTNPGPPFTVEISSNTATQDPLVEASRTYKVTGIVRNDGDQTYAVSAIHVTFYDAEGFRGTFTPAIRDGKLVGGEWDWHAESDAEFAALLLAPGEAWPFSIQITAQNMASFLIHPDATPTERESIDIELSNVRLAQDSTDFVRITGTATNNSTYKAKNVTVTGALLDADGKIVSVGSVYVLQEDIEPGTSVSFDVRIEKEAYIGYQLYAQAERDWD